MALQYTFRRFYSPPFGLATVRLATLERMGKGSEREGHVTLKIVAGDIFFELATPGDS